MTTKQKILQRRVNRGTAWLNSWFGEGNWANRIVGGNLNLARGNTCMIGQLFPQRAEAMYNNFNAVVRGGTLTVKQAKALGFLLPDSAILPWIPVSMDYGTLTDIWLDQVAQVQKSDAEATAEKTKGTPSPIQQKDLAKKV